MRKYNDKIILYVLRTEMEKKRVVPYATSFSFEASIRKRMGIMVITINLVGLFFFIYLFSGKGWKTTVI